MGHAPSGIYCCADFKWDRQAKLQYIDEKIIFKQRPFQVSAKHSSDI